MVRPCMARGSAAGEVPRRSLAVTTVLAGVTLLCALVWHVDGSTLVLVCSAFQVAVSAALRLLEKRSGAWWAALVSLVFISALLVLSGKYIVAPVVLAGLALAYSARRTRRDHALRQA
jgi:amino acid efflux transporter